MMYGRTPMKVRNEDEPSVGEVLLGGLCVALLLTFVLACFVVTP